MLTRASKLAKTATIRISPISSEADWKLNRRSDMQEIQDERIILCTATLQSDPMQCSEQIFWRGWMRRQKRSLRGYRFGSCIGCWLWGMD